MITITDEDDDRAYPPWPTIARVPTWGGGQTFQTRLNGTFYEFWVDGDDCGWTCERAYQEIPVGRYLIEHLFGTIIMEAIL